MSEYCALFPNLINTLVAEITVLSGIGITKLLQQRV